MITFEQIEAAIVSRLTAQAGDFRSVATYAGEFEREYASLTTRLPAAFVVYAEGKYEHTDQATVTETATFTVIVAARSLRDRGASAREGAAGSPGAYDLVEDVLSALVNQDLGLGIERLSVKRVQLAVMSQGVAAYTVDFTTWWDREYLVS